MEASYDEECETVEEATASRASNHVFYSEWGVLMSGLQPIASKDTGTPANIIVPIRDFTIIYSSTRPSTASSGCPNTRDIAPMPSSFLLL